MKRAWTIVCLAVAACAGMTCSGDGEGPSTPAAPGQRRVVSVAPSATELLFALGAGARVIGVTDFCRHPEAAAERERIGGYMTPSLERILALAPDLVCYFPSVVENPERFAAGLIAAGITPLPLTMGDIPQVYEAARTLAVATGTEPQAATLIQTLRAELEAVRAAHADRPPRRVIIAVDGDPTQCFVAGGDTFIDSLLALAGGQNAAAERPGYYVISAEALVAADPDVIIDASRVHQDPDAAASATSAAWQPLQALRAVREGRVRTLSNDAAIQPGPRMAEGARALAALLHDPAETPR